MFMNDLENTAARVKYRRDYREPAFFIESVDVCVQLFAGYSLVESCLLIQRNRQQAVSELILDGEKLELLSVWLDGSELTDTDYRVDEYSLTIFNCPDRFELKTQVKIYPEDNKSLEGLYQSNGKYCSQCEAEGFRKITYFLDRPDVMAIFNVRIEADKRAYPYLLSNGNKTDSGDLDNGRHFACWHDPFKKPSYLFALCAGDYDLLEDHFVTRSGRKVLLQIFVDKGKLEQCHHAMESLKKSMRWDEEVFDLEYDLDVYMIVAVADFNMGAMENKGLNVFNTQYVLASQETATDDDFEGVEAVIAHEYFHNWTGNRVTCRDWFQLSLKEGLTVFRDQQFTADQTDPAVKRIADVKVIRAHQFAEDAGPMAHPIRPDSYIEMNNFYTVTVYNKGAEIIRMYHSLLGQSGFKKGMDLYFKRHDGEAVTCEDFVCAMEDANNYELKQFRRWYSQAGTPEIAVSSHYDSEAKTLALDIEQRCPATADKQNKEPFHIPLRLGLLDSYGEDITLELAAHSDARLEKDILHITEFKHRVYLENLAEKPTLSLLRDFSAPVKLAYEYSEDELCFLFAQDSDTFNRWDAGQRLFTETIWQLYQSLGSNSGEHLELSKSLVLSVKKVLEDSAIDGQFKALALAVPDVKTLFETVAVLGDEALDLDRLLDARQFLIERLALSLEDSWLAIYQSNRSGASFSQDKEAVARRAVANRCLLYLVQCQSENNYRLAEEQFIAANNMTDGLAAFKALMHSDYSGKADIAEQFYQKWKGEDLVVDKWLRVVATQGSERVIDDITALTEHPAFDKTNPNKVRALIGAFAGANMRQFHRKDGAGYRLLAEQIKALYAVNPQTAARLTGAFNSWRKLDDERQKLIKQELESILSVPDLSRDVYEIASKALK